MPKISLLVAMAITLTTAGCVSYSGDVFGYPKLSWSYESVDDHKRNVKNPDTGVTAYYNYDGAGRYRCISRCRGFPAFLAASAVGGLPAPDVDRAEGDGGPDDGH